MPNFTVLFSISSTWLCIAVSYGQVHIALEMLREVSEEVSMCQRDQCEAPCVPGTAWSTVGARLRLTKGP